MRAFSVCLIAAFALTGCKEAKDTYTVTTDNGQQAKVEVERGSNSVTITSEDGNAQISVGGGVVNLPAYAPHYPGAQTGMSMVGQGKDGKGQMVSLTTTDPADKVLAFYQEKMTAAGLKPTVNVKGSNGFASIVAEDANKMGAMVTIIPGEGQTIISIISGSDVK